MMRGSKNGTGKTLIADALNVFFPKLDKGLQSKTACIAAISKGIQSIVTELSRALVCCRDVLYGSDLQDCLIAFEQVRQDFMSRNAEHVQAFIKGYKIDYKVAGAHHIPKDGRAVIVSNHSLSILDAILLAMVSGKDIDKVQFPAAHMFQIFDPKGEFLVPIDIGKKRKLSDQEREGLQVLMASKVGGGEPLLILPCGENTKPGPHGKRIDGEWKTTALRVAVKAGVSIIPVFIDFDAGGHAEFNQLASSGIHKRLGKFHAALRVLTLAKNIRVYVGEPIDAQKLLDNFGGNYKYASEYLRIVSMNLAPKPKSDG